MKRRDHGPLVPVYVRCDPELRRELEKLRLRTEAADMQFVGLGEVARRLLHWAVLHYPKNTTPPRE